MKEACPGFAPFRVRDQLVFTGGGLELMRAMPGNSVDLVVTSPPYESQRKYGAVRYALTGDAWADWCYAMFEACLRVCRGPVCWVVNAPTRNYEWSPSLLKLMLRIGESAFLRKPLIYKRSSVPGSGGPDYFRDNYEFVIVATRHPGRLRWSDNTAMGEPPKYAPGGAMTYRGKDDKRAARGKTYRAPKLANPGNVIECKVGGGLIGSRLAHLNEAPFPERLAEFLVRSFCPPGGFVLDPMCGSGTVLAVAQRRGLCGIGADIRHGQAALAALRLADDDGRVPLGKVAAIIADAKREASR